MNNNIFNNKKNNKKAGLAIIAVMIIILILFNVKVQSVSQYKTQQQSMVDEYNLISEKQSGNGTVNSNTEKETVEAIIPQNIINESDISTNEGSEIISINSSENQNVGVNISNSTIGDGLSNNDSNFENASIDSSKEQEKSANSETEYVTCSIKISCDAISNNMSKWSNPNKDKNKIIPTDGLFLSREITVESGSSVYDVLIKAAAINDIKIVTKSYYIVSINQLAEKDAGSNSGWMYSVNDTEPLSVCSTCYVKNGDKILWYYVVSE